MLHRKWRRRLGACLAGVLVVAGGVAFIAWYKLFRVVPHPPFETAEMQFKYGSLGAEAERGIPYYVWLVLPRIFSDKMPGPGGYASFGFAWEPGQELPAGFAKKTVGFPRVTNNCAICHTATYRTHPEGETHFVTAGPSHTANLQAYMRFLADVARDPRFNADTILNEIALVYDNRWGRGGLSWLDRMLYRWAIIPLTRKALLEQDRRFAWMNRPHWPDWGPGRDDPMNLTKYFMTNLPVDSSTGQADFPSIWNLDLREGQAMNFAGETPSQRSVIIDSALGLGAPPGEGFLRRMEEIETLLRKLPPPRFPYWEPSPYAPIASLAERGRPLYARYCAECHEKGGRRVGTVIDIAEIGTDPERLNTWTQEAADQANRAVEELGIERKIMVKTNGYAAEPIDGAWLRAPYLHNGSVPSLEELLLPAAARTKVFYRGYNVYDPVRVGFVTQGEEAQRVGFRFDTSVRGNGNQGHEYGVDLQPDDRKALLEYLKGI
jgi:mono/diheme cytochrome c family protein